jgi:phosphoserine aminotransferase
MSVASDFRADNFSAGPASLPTAVLERARAELLNWDGRGVSVMEISHRSKPFIEVAARAEQNLRTLMNIPDDYAVLFLQGGASLQFSSVVLNLTQADQSAAYVDTGIWSAKAVKEAKKYLSVNLVASTKEAGYHSVPTQAQIAANLSSDDQFLHYCPNETINGVAFDYVPKADMPLVADFSSVILAEPIQVSDFGVIYAGAQKNVGPAGLTLVIVKRDLLDKARDNCPAVMNYGLQAAADSMLNTPATYSWYLSGLVFEWLIEQGGVDAIAKINHQKSQMLYSAIDSSKLYSNPVAIANRSIMNVPFYLADESLNAEFLRQSEETGLLHLKGHRTVGGMRASIYNAVPLEAVERLVQFMHEFELKHA